MAVPFLRQRYEVLDYSIAVRRLAESSTESTWVPLAYRSLGNALGR